MVHTYVYKSHKEFLDTRRRLSGFGGSEIGTLLNSPSNIVNPWKSKIQLFYEKIGYTEPKPIYTANTWAGHALESEIMHKFWAHYDPENPDVDNTAYNGFNGIIIREATDPKTIYQNENYPHIFSSPDGLFSHRGSMDAILEIKLPSSFALKRHKDTFGLAEAYIWQVQSYMATLESDYAEVAMLKDGKYLEVYPLDRSEKMISIIKEITHREWERVEMGRKMMRELSGDELDAELQNIEPELDGSERNFLDDRGFSEGILEGEGEHQELRDNYMTLLSEERTIRESKDLIKNTFINILQTAKCNEMRLIEGKVTYKGKIRIT